MRRLAGEVNASTQVLYTMFGGKDGLAEALFLEGFDRLAAANAVAAPEGLDPLERLFARAGSYADNALENPHYYRVMFANAIPGYRPSPETLARTWPNFTSLEGIVRDCAEAGHLSAPVARAPREPALALWSAWHGVVSLLLSDHLPDEQEARRVLDLATTSVVERLRTATPPERT